MIKADGSRCGLTAAKSKNADGHCYQHMGAQRRRTWGAIKRLRSGYHASYVGPGDQRHYALTMLMAKVNAEVWLAKERRLIDLDEWTSPLAARTQRVRPSCARVDGRLPLLWATRRTLSLSGECPSLAGSSSDSLSRTSWRAAHSRNAGRRPEGGGEGWTPI